MLPWFGFPALPLALLTLWQQRKKLIVSPPLQLGLMMFSVNLGVLLVSASARNAYGWPMLVALSLLAAPAVVTLSDRLNLYLDGAARLLFTALAGLCWTVWVIMMVTGWAPEWKFLTRVLPGDYVMPFIPLAFAVAVVSTLAYLLAWIWLPRLHERAMVSMAAGIALCWLLLASLWLPWIDYAKSYRSVFAAMQPHLPENRRCVASVGMDESELSMLLYFSDVLTLRREKHPNANCDVLLVYGQGNVPPKNLSPNWRQVWEGARPGDNIERFWLFVQQTNSFTR